VNQHEIDGVDSQSFQAGLDGSKYRTANLLRTHVPVKRWRKRTEIAWGWRNGYLAGNVRMVCHLIKSLADDLLADSVVPVGVEQVDAQIESAVKKTGGLLLIRHLVEVRSGKSVVHAQLHSSQADFGNTQSCVSKHFVFRDQRPPKGGAPWLPFSGFMFMRPLIFIVQIVIYTLAHASVGKEH